MANVKGKPAKKIITKAKVKKGKKPDQNFSLIREIRKEKDYKNNIGTRNRHARAHMMKEGIAGGPGSAVPGQLISFNYFQPKWMEELPYYDAQPLTIFFGTFKTKDGPRIMGFNIHYYPPKIRFQIMDRIMEIWKPMYLKQFETGISSGMMHFNYQWLQMQLESHGLGFGVRMYIPALTANMKVIAPKDWQKAVFSEGSFKKQTREAIMAYWAQFRRKPKI